MSQFSGLSVRHQRARQASFRPVATEMLEQRVLLTSVVVNTTADVAHASGSTIISLRDAINTANKSASPTTVSFSPSVFGTHRIITLSGSALEFSGKQPLIISGPTPGVTIDGNAKSADLAIDKGATASVYRVTFTGGNNTTSDGGAIANNGALTLDAVIVTANADIATTPSDGSGGGIYNGGTLKLVSVVVSDNTADGFGGGIYNTGSMTTSGVTVSGNRGDGHDADEPTSQGGGIDNTGSMSLNYTYITGNGGGSTAGGIENESGAKMTLANTAISGNSAIASGGIDNQGTATVTHSTVSGNSSGFFADPGGSAAGSTGGISNEGAITLVDCTIAGNSSSYEAGGIYNSAKLTLADCTISNNTAISAENGPAFQQTLTPGDGGGLFAAAGSSTLIENTIIAGNKSVGGKGPDVYGAVQSNGFNLIGEIDNSSGWKSSDRTGSAAHPLSALLSRLGYYGGATETMIPMANSPAVNHGSNALIPAGITTDQRGLPRISGGIVDIGSVELQAAHTGAAA